jgi:multiple sugar transport system permease protein
MVLPAAVILAVVLGWPVIRLFYLSLHFLQLTSPEVGMPFIGLENFRMAMNDPEMWGSLGRTLVFSFSTLFIELVIGVTTAVALNRASTIFNVIRGLLLLPWMLMWPVVAIIWSWIFNGQYGIINYILIQLKWVDGPVQFLGTPGLTMGIVIWTSAWREFPIAMIFTLAGLQSIDDAYFEAARIDGASRWQEFWRITFPLLRPTLLLILLLRTTFALRTFELIFVMTGGGPAGTTHVIATYIYEKAFINYDLGFGSALSVILLLITLIISFLYVILMPKESN